MERYEWKRLEKRGPSSVSLDHVYQHVPGNNQDKSHLNKCWNQSVKSAMRMVVLFKACPYNVFETYTVLVLSMPWE